MTDLRAKILLPLFGIGLVCSGCVTYQLAPHVAGNVVDGSTKEPLPNAVLYFNAFPQDVVLAADGGFFDLPAIQHITFLSGPPKDMAMSQILTVKADGYQTREIEIAWTGRQAPAKTNEIIYLQPN
jgi:hypothetical protein